MNIFSQLWLLVSGAEHADERTMQDKRSQHLEEPKMRTVVRHGKSVTYDENSEYCDGDGTVWSYNTDAVYERYRDNPSGGNDNPNSAPWGWVGEKRK